MSDIVDKLSQLGKQGEDHIWRTALEAKDEIVKLRGAMQKLSDNMKVGGSQGKSHQMSDWADKKAGEITDPAGDDNWIEQRIELGHCEMNESVVLRLLRNIKLMLFWKIRGGIAEAIRGQDLE